MKNRKGQTVLEYTVIMVIIIGVMIGMKDYVKRGIQGRWKSSTDDLGDQYDPQAVNSDITYSTQVNANSIIVVTNGDIDTPGGGQQAGQWTTRTDTTNSVETKTGYTQVGD